MKQISLSLSQKKSFFSEVSQVIKDLDGVWQFFYDNRELFPFVDYDFKGHHHHFENEDLRMELMMLLFFLIELRNNLLNDEK